MSERKRGHKTGDTWHKAWRKLNNCTSGSAVAVDDTAHKPKDTYYRSDREYSKGTNSKQSSYSELPKLSAPPKTPASSTTSYYSDAHPVHQRSVHHERNQDSGHRYATSAGPNFDSSLGWPLLKVSPPKWPPQQRNLGAEFEQEQQVRQGQPEPGFESRAVESRRHAELNIGVHNGSQRLTPVESQNSVQGHPAGSYADDGTGPSPKILLTTFAGVKEALNSFTKHYIASMKGDMAEWEVLEEFIKKDVTVKTSRANHWKFVVQAYISSRLFEGFDKHDYGLDGIQDYTEVECFQQFRDCNDKVETTSRLLSSNIPADSFLSKFCFQKYKRVVENPLTKEPFLSHNPDIENGLHPNTRFYCSFLKVALSVWLLHRLRFSFVQKCKSVNFLKGDGFNTMCMESVVPYCEGEGDDDDDDDDNQKGGEDSQNLVVGFMVLPGLQVGEALVKSEVYLVRAEELDKAAVDAGKSSIMDELSAEDSSHGHTDYGLVDGVQEFAPSSPLQQNNRSSNEQISTPAKPIGGELKTVSHANAGKNSNMDELSAEDSSHGHTDYGLVDGVQEFAPSSPLQQNNRSSNEQISTPAKLIGGESRTVSHAKTGHQKSGGKRYMDHTISSIMKTSPTVNK